MGYLIFILLMMIVTLPIGVPLILMATARGIEDEWKPSTYQPMAQLVARAKKNALNVDAANQRRAA